MSIRENIQKIKTDIPNHVTLVAVSKTKPNEMILEAYDNGQRDFGENYVQELIEKQQTLPKDIRWHFIGHLQSNKVKFIAPFVHLIHGVDSLKLLQEINKQGKKNNRTINCLLQIFIAREETKFGLSFEECEHLLDGEIFAELQNIKVLGFMAMASNTDDDSQIEKEFAALKNFYDKVSGKFPSISILSVGMSSDFHIAIKQGSNMIRLGSTIFGSR
jgi:pyridoxal phosphate enzyme (YggS family)